MIRFTPMRLGIVVLAAVFVLAAASGSSLGGMSSGRSRRRSRARRRGLSVCHEATPELRNARTVPTAQPAAPPVPPPPPPVAGDPPSRDDLGRALGAVEAEMRTCVAATASGNLFVDADIAGEGRVTQFVLAGEVAPSANTTCLARSLGRMRFTPFPDSIRVRWQLGF